MTTSQHLPPPLLLPRRCTVTLKAHAGACHVARYDSRGRYLVTAGQDRLVKLWSVASLGTSSPAPIKTYGSSGAGHSREVHALDVSRDNARFASGGADKNVLVWDVASGSVLRRFSAHEGRINDVRFAASASSASASAGSGTDTAGPANVLLTAGSDATLRWYDLRAQGAYRPMVECRDAQGAIQALAVQDGAAAVWTGSTDGVVRRYDVRMGTITEDTVDEPITSLSLSTTSSTSSSPLLLVSHSTTSTSLHPNPRHLLFDTSDGSLLQTFQQPHEKAPPSSSSLRPHACILPHTLGGSHVLAGDAAGNLRAWEVLSGKELDRIPSSDAAGAGAGADANANSRGRAGPASITWTECSPADAHEAAPGNARAVQAVTASVDGTVRLWGP